MSTMANVVYDLSVMVKAGFVRDIFGKNWYMDQGQQDEAEELLELAEEAGGDEGALDVLGPWTLKLKNSVIGG